MAVQDVITVGVGSAPGTVAFLVTRGLGAISPTEDLTYAVEVDWDADGDYLDANEDITADVWSVEISRGRDYASQLTGRAIAGRCRITLGNSDGKYSPFNTDSPLFGSILPKRRVRVRAVWPLNIVLWTGDLDSIRPAALSPGDVPTATLEATGVMARLTGKRVTPAASPGADTGALIGTVLTAAGIVAGDQVLDTGATTTGRWYEPDTSALEAARRLEETELGFLYEDEAARYVYEKRGHRLVSDHLTVQAEFSDEPGAALGYQGITEEDPLRELYNEIPVTVQPYTLQSEAILWTLSGETPTLTAGETKAWWAQYPDAGAATGAYVEAWTTPVVGTDITQTGVSNGDIAVVVSKFGNAMKISITNNHVSDTATITLLRAKGTAVTQDNPVRIVAEDTDSQDAYGQRTFRLPGPWYANTDDAQSLADLTLARHKDPQAILILSFVANSSLALKQQSLTRKISDRVLVTADGDTQLGIDGREFFIEAIQHQIDRRGKLHTVTWSLSQAELDAGFWVLGTSLLGIDTRLYG